MTGFVDEESTSDVALSIMTVTVQLLNTQGVARTTELSIWTAAGLDEFTFRRHYSSANDVFVEIARFMMSSYGDAIATTVARRSSLRESLQLAHRAFLGVMEELYDTQDALLKIRMAAAVDPRVGVPVEAAISMHEGLLISAELWLIEVGQLHDVVWTLPLKTLAAFVCAGMTGMVMEYLVRRDMAESVELADLMAYDLSRVGRRRAKQGSF